MGNNKGVKHIALEIVENDLNDFYQDILHCKVISKRILNKDDANQIFGVNNSVNIYYVKGDGFELELFVNHDSSAQQFSHICLETERANEIFQQSLKEEYRVKKRGREQSPTYFIKDRNGNIFEIKNKIK